MAQVFISYSSKTKDQVQTLAQDLEMAGYQIWFDHKLTGGQAWWDQILEQIRQSDLFVFALTPESMDSYPCKLEYTYAHDLGKNVLPVVLSEGVSVNLLPPPLTTIQFVDYCGDDKQAAFRLMNALNNLPPTRPLPEPLPTAPEVPISYIGNLTDQIDAPRPLSFEEQTSLVFRLKEHLQEEDTRDDAATLLKRLRKRDDLYAKIGEEIDSLLSSSAPPVVQSRPTPPASPPTQPIPARPPAADPQRVTVVQPQQSGDDAAWGTGLMIVLAVGTFFIFPVGLIAGVIGMRSPAKRNQGIGLLAFGIIMAVLYLISAMGDFYYFY